MKINFSDKRIIILLCFAIILLAVNVYLSLQPKGQDNSSMYKAFAEQTHSSIQSLKNSSESLSAELVEKPDMNAEEKADLALMKEFYNSMDSDIKWISEKRTLIIGNWFQRKTHWKQTN